MVCVPCFVIPALLFIFRIIIQPLVYRFWGHRMQEPALTCPMPQKKKNNATNSYESEGVPGTASPEEVDSGDTAKIKKCD